MEEDGGERKSMEDEVMTWLLTDEEEEEDDELLSSLLSTEEGSGEMRWSGDVRVKFTADPYSSPLIFQSSSSSYVTINGNNDESCGSSFSDLDASVMASFFCTTAAVNGGREGGGTMGCDDVAYGEDWDFDELARFLVDQEDLLLFEGGV